MRAGFYSVEWNFLWLFLAGCGGTLYGDSGLFTSPGYPGTYPNHTHCEWAIIAPSGRLVTVSFYFISIDDPGDCVQNYLILFDGPDVNSPSSGPYCGAVSNTDFWISIYYVQIVKVTRYTFKVGHRQNTKHNALLQIRNRFVTFLFWEHECHLVGIVLN